MRTLLVLGFLCVGLGGAVEALPAAARDGLPDTPEKRRAIQLIEDNRHAGAEGARRLYREIGALRPEHRGMVMEAISEMKSAEAQDLLLQIACGSLGPETEEGGGAYFLASIAKDADARRLLAAKNPKVWGVGVRALTKAKVPLDADLMQSVTRILQSTNLHVRNNCAYYLETEPGAGLGREKVSALIDSLATVERCPEASKTVYDYHGLSGIWTQGDRTCQSLIAALSQTAGVDLAMLREMTPVPAGLARDCVLVARGWRFDRELKPELYRIMRENPVAGVRFAAVNTFHHPGYGDLDDDSALKQVATSDPLCATLDAREKVRYEEANPGKKAPDQMYPVRDHALWAIELIRRQSKQ